MKVILTKDMDDLGFEGDIINVAKGYARNFLIPKGIALEAIGSNIKLMESKRKKIELKRVKAQEDAERYKEQLSSIEINISQKVGEEEKLYGSVTSMDIAAELEKQGITVDRRKINLDKPIKSLGQYSVPIKIYANVSGSIKVNVIPEEAG